MKQFLLIFQLLCFINLYAQHFQTPTQKVNTIKFANVSGYVSIEGTTNKEISIDYYSDDAQSKTLPGNTGVGLELQKLDSAWVFTGLLSETSKGRYAIKVPEKTVLNYQSDADHTRHVVIAKCKGDIDINIPKDVTLTEVSGGVVIQSTSGKVTVNSIAISKHKPVSIITETGPISLAIPANTNAELKLGTATGTVHAAYNNEKGKTLMNGKQLNTKLGTGGPQIHIQSLSGDIHFVQY
ncbi:DUF4097 family beta strand repeat-containing protein [Niastella sp. OAS944]|uniref:DUF4097 family beta strand repeat-containing protein n=1 Tax=Niastella sp. OAS944 TaxID=2664089 RepID=UPI00348EE452|nr:hypothetical protein [Chitinophagaceae bacterium OAS944]